jgi:hypothetical protein
MPDDDALTDADFEPPPYLMGPEDPVAYDAWFRAKVENAMASTEPGIPHEVVMARMQAIIGRHKDRS